MFTRAFVVCLVVWCVALAQDAKPDQSQVSVACNGDRNAVRGCGINCGRHCNNYMRKNVVCPLICLQNACDCKPKYVFDDNTKKCVLPKDCTPVCKANEVFSACSNGGCFPPRDCSRKGGAIICVDLIEGGCRPGCLCKEGYLRDANKICIPEDKCPPIKDHAVDE